MPSCFAVDDRLHVDKCSITGINGEISPIVHPSLFRLASCGFGVVRKENSLCFHYVFLEKEGVASKVSLDFSISYPRV